MLQDNSHASDLKTEINLYIHIRHFYLIYCFCLWPGWPHNLWLNFLFNGFIHANAHVLWTETVLCLYIYGLYSFFMPIISVLHAFSWFSVCIGLLMIYLLVDGFSNQKKYKKPITFCFFVLRLL